MKIAVDGRQIGVHVGKGRYITELIRNLADIDTKNEYILYVNRPLSFPVPNNFISVSLPAGKQQFFMVRDAKAQGADIFFAPTAYLPVLLSKIPCIVTIHDLALFLVKDAKPALRTLLAERLQLKAACRKAKAILAVSESTKKDLTALFSIPTEKIFTTPLAYDNERFIPASKETASLDARVVEKLKLPKQYILFVGTVEPRKNVGNLLRAYSQLPEELRHQYPLLIGGKKGWNYEGIFQTYEELNLKDQARFLGQVDDNDLPSLYRKSKLFVFPSHYEGVGLPVLESIACHVPAITSNVSSLPEVAQDAGLLINPQDISGLAKAIEQLLTDTALYKQLQNNCQKVADQFSWGKTAQETLKSFTKAVR